MKQLFLYLRMAPSGQIPKIVEGRSEKVDRRWREIAVAKETDQSRGPRFIPWINVCHALEFTAFDLNEPNIGLKLAYNHPVDFYNLGAAVFILKQSKNVREFIQLGTRYQYLHTNGFTINVEEDASSQEVTMTSVFHPMSGPHRQCQEHFFGLIAIFLKKFLDKDYIRRVTFQHRAPKDMAWYEKLFPNAEIRFDTPLNTMVYDNKILGIGSNSYVSRTLEKAAEFYLSRKMKRHPYAEKPFSATVTEMLPTLVSYQKSDIGSAAHLLRIHPKKLQRLLREEGKNYSEILDNVRQEQAVRLLEDSDIPIQQIASILDYSSSQAFILAFNRWFEKTPRQYRTQSINT